MADIFISYDNEDRDRVVPIVAALENQGWSTFWDWKSIPVAKTWRQFIKEGLEQARCVLVLWSGKSIDSEWVIEEADHGKANRRLIPAMIDDVPPPIGFGQIQAAKLIHWTGDVNNAEFKKLVDAIESILGPSPRRVREAGEEEKELIKREQEKEKEKEKEANRASLEKSERAGEPPAPTLSVPAAG